MLMAIRICWDTSLWYQQLICRQHRAVCNMFLVTTLANIGSAPCCTPSYGWGELSSVTLPTGAQAQYQYVLDGQNGPGFGYMWTDVLKNAITRKSLTYQQQYDGSSTPVTETWNYALRYGVATQPGYAGWRCRQAAQ